MKHSQQVVQGWLRRIVGHEGGLSLDPKDRGNWTGRAMGSGQLKGTKWGISAASYPDLDIQALTIDDAEGIYRRDFLDIIKADRYEDGVAFQLLDFAVNSGPQAALRAIQQAINVKVDGIIGPVTLKALDGYTEAQLIMLLLSERLRYMSNAVTWNIHGRGWVRRIAEDLEFGAKDII